MRAKITKTNLVLSLIFTVLLLCLFNDIWVWRKPLTVDASKARIDVYTKEKGEEYPSFKLYNDDRFLLPANWMAKAGMQGYSFERKNYSIEFEILSRKDETIFIDLRGLWVLKNPKNRSEGLLPYWVNYEKLSINGDKNLLSQPVSAWHNEPYIYKLAAKAGQKYNVLVEWTKTNKGKMQTEIDYYLLIILTVLAFLFSSKIVKYLAQFKTKQLKSRIDIVFLCTFFALLFVPMMHISEAEKSDQENRMLAKYEPLWKDGKLNLKYGEQFEKWFNDRFFGRDGVIDLNNFINLHINRFYENSRAIYDQKTGWMFNKPYVFTVPNNETVNLIIDNLKKFNSFCKDNNIRFYLMIVPDKSSVYQDELVVRAHGDVNTTKFKKYIEKIISSMNEDQIIYPYDDLKEGAKSDYVFFKESHHWTDWGAYIGYKNLMEKVVKDFKDIPIVSLQEYNKSSSRLLREDFFRNYDLGHTVNVLKLRKIAKDKILKTDYIYYDNKSDLKTEIINVEGKKGKEFYFEKGSPYRLLMMGTSQNEDLSQFLPYSFQNTKYIRFNNVIGRSSKDEFKVMKYYKQGILDFKPDIVIMTLIPEHMVAIQNFFKD